MVAGFAGIDSKAHPAGDAGRRAHGRAGAFPAEPRDRPCSSQPRFGRTEPKCSALIAYIRNGETPALHSDGHDCDIAALALEPRSPPLLEPRIIILGLGEGA
jgi:hypothetical protein